MAQADDARRKLKEAAERQKATREATQKVAADIASDRENQSRQAQQTEVGQ